MEHERTCFFIGHREANERVLPALEQAVEQLIVESGVTDFVVGHYGAFDGMAAKVIKAAKKRHPEVTLALLLPYHPFDRPTPVPKGYDSTFYPPGMENVPKKYAIVRANRYMVDHSGYLIKTLRMWSDDRPAQLSWQQMALVFSPGLPFLSKYDTIGFRFLVAFVNQ